MKSTDIKTINEKILNQARKMRGYLEKESYHAFIGFQKRFFLIIQDNLVYFLDQTLDQPRGYIQIRNIKNLKSTGTIQFSFKYYERIFHLKSTNTQNRDQWIASLKLIIYFLNHNKQKETQYIDVPLKWNKKEMEQKLKVLAQMQIQKKMKSAKENNLVSWSRLIFKKLSLYKLYEEFDDQKVKNRLLIRKFKEGYYLLISCKSLNKDFEDEEILSPQYISPYDFNILYEYDNEKNLLTEILKASKISSIQIIDEKYLKINNLLLTYEQSIQQFVENLKVAVKIGQEYHNDLKIPLRKNVEITIKMYQEAKTQFAKQQILRIKFEDQFCKIINKYDKNYRRFPSSFLQLLNQLLDEIKNFIGAFRVKAFFRMDIVTFFVQFMHDKIKMNLRLFWNQHYQNLNQEELLELTSWVYEYCEIVKDFQKENELMKGIKILNKIFFRKIFKSFENSISDKFLKNFEISIANTTKLPFEFSNMIQKIVKSILKIDHIQSPHIKIEEYINQCYQILCQKIIEFIKKQNNVNILMALCNDISLYKKQIEYIKQIDFRFINKINTKMHNLLIKRIVKIMRLSAQVFDKNFTAFFDIHIDQIAQKLLRLIQKMDNLQHNSLTLMKIKTLQELIGYYFQILVNNISTQQISYQLTLHKLQTDRLKIKSIYQQYIPINILQEILKVFDCINSILKDEDSQILQQSSIWIRTNFIYSYIHYKQIQKLLNLRYIAEIKRNRILKICLQIFEDQCYNRNMFDQQLIIIQKNEIFARKSSFTFDNQIVICQGYLQKKQLKVDSNYQKSYFIIQNQNLNWFMTLASTEIIGSLRIIQCHKIYQHLKHPNKFIIEMTNNTIYKFKAIDGDSAKNWIESLQATKNLSKNNIQQENEDDQNSIFIDYLSENRRFIQNKQSLDHQREFSIISLEKIRSDSTKVELLGSRRRQKQINQGDSSKRKSQKKKVPFWRKFSCFKTEDQWD